MKKTNTVLMLVLLIIQKDIASFHSDKIEVSQEEKEKLFDIMRQGTQVFCNLVVKNNSSSSKDVSQKLRDLGVQGLKSACSVCCDAKTSNILLNRVKIIASFEKEDLKVAISGEEFLETELGKQWREAYEKCENYKMESQCVNVVMMELTKFALPRIICPLKNKTETNCRKSCFKKLFN